MTIAQTKAARRKFRQFYRKDNPVGTPYYKRKSSDKLTKLEIQRRERQRMIADRKRKK